MIILAFPLSIFKSVMILKYKDDKSRFEDKPDLWKFVGVYNRYPGLSVTVDLV